MDTTRWTSCPFCQHEHFVSPDAVVGDQVTCEVSNKNFLLEVIYTPTSVNHAVDVSD